MKKGMLILIVLILIVSFFCLVKEKKVKKENSDINNNPYQIYSFYKKENYNRYLKYQFYNSDLSPKDIVLRVNIGLDNSFYTNTKEVTSFNKLMIVNKYNYVAKDFKVPKLTLISSYAKKDIYLEKEAMEAFVKMAQAAEKEGYNLRAISAYRAYEYQENLYRNYVKNDGVTNADSYSARPGFSEHHTGLAVDIDNTKVSYLSFETTKEFLWMQQNSYKYGFILRYPKNKTEITGYIYEPWHYRYLGLEVADYIHKYNVTYEEYYYEFVQPLLQKTSF